jgi:uncharacterized cupin superfamily protein
MARQSRRSRGEGKGAAAAATFERNFALAGRRSSCNMRVAHLALRRLGMKIDVSNAPSRVGSRYPKPYDEPCRKKRRRHLGVAAGLAQFGVNLLELEPGAWSSQRHWHARADEFVYVIRGPVVLVNDAGETTLETGDCAGFKAGEPNGHHLQNRGQETALVLEVGTPGAAGGEAEYPDIDLRATTRGFVHKDGTPY